VSTVEAVPATRERRLPRWIQFWRSPQGQPVWARPGLLTIAGFVAVLYAWRIADSGFATYYSIAAKSMSVSWKAFFYGALDPGATITIDKLAGAFAPQALSARVFGYHAWALTLPEVIEGIVTVLVMYRIGRRWQGPACGLLAAGLFGLTPVVASMFGHPMEDGLLVMCLVLAADSLQRAVLQARLRSLLWAGFWVGVGFQAKMMQAWMIVPALAVTYLIAAPAGLGRRFAQLAAGGAVLFAVSLSWIALYAVTPADHRPYVDGSTNNSAVAMVFGYNGFSRFGLDIPGAIPPMNAAGGGQSTGPPPRAAGGPGGAPGGAQGGAGAVPQGVPAGGAGMGPGIAAHGKPPGNAPQGAATPKTGTTGSGGGPERWTKLLTPAYATQIGWLYPAAVLGLIVGLVMRGRSPRTDPVRAGYVLWGIWLITVAAVFSDIAIPHTAYMSSLAPPIAALTAGGIVLAWRAYRDRTARWLLPALAAVELAWTLYLAAKVPTFLPWLRPLVGVVGVLAVAVLVAGMLIRVGAGTRQRRAALTTAMAFAVAAMVAIPAVWATSVLDAKYGGSAFEASAGPTAGSGGGRAVAGPGGPSGGNGRRVENDPTTLSSERQRIYDYLVAHRDGAKFVAAAESWNTAGPYITATGGRFMPMGGFSGSAPQPTLEAVKGLIRAGHLRFFLLVPDVGGLDNGPGPAGTASAVAAWVKSACAKIPAAAYGGTDASTVPAGFGDFGAGGSVVYHCASA